MLFLLETIFQGSLALEQYLTGVVRFLICVKWYQSFDYFTAMSGDNDGLQDLFTRMCTVEGEINTVKSTLDNVAQTLKSLSLKIDD